METIGEERVQQDWERILRLKPYLPNALLQHMLKLLTRLCLRHQVNFWMTHFCCRVFTNRLCGLGREFKLWTLGFVYKASTSLLLKKINKGKSYLPCNDPFKNEHVVGHHWFKAIVHPKMKMLSLITHPHVVPNPLDLLSFSEHKLRYLLIKFESFLTLHRLQENYHIQSPEM